MLASPPLPDPNLVAERAPAETGAEAKDPRRVLVVARWPVGGIRTHLGYNYPVLAAAGYRCTFVVPWDESYPAVRNTLGRLPGSEFVTVLVRGRHCSLWQTIRPLLRSGRYSLVHAHGLTAAAHATLAGLGSETPLLVTLHEPLRDAQFGGLVGSLKRWMLGRALARAATVVTVSEDARANLLRHFPNLRRRAGCIQAISNGIDSGRYADAKVARVSDAGLENPPRRGGPHDAGLENPPRRGGPHDAGLENPPRRGGPHDAGLENPPRRGGPLGEASAANLRKELGLTGDTTLIGYLGRFMPEKGFPLLMEAAARMVKYGGVAPFHVVAFGSSDYRREYQHGIEQQGLTRHFTLKDFVPDVLPVLRQLDLVVTPSLWEASSLVSMEAMAAGVPVLGSDCHGLREVLRDTPSRTFKTGDAAALECGLREALAELWTAEARGFAPQARERFDNRRSARLLTQLYDELTA